jgi:hypothetical protein
MVTLGAAQTAASLAFKTPGYSLSGSTLTMDPSPATFSVDPNVTATIASTIAGSATMTKIGDGTLILSSTSNINTASAAAGGLAHRTAARCRSPRRGASPRRIPMPTAISTPIFSSISPRSGSRRRLPISINRRTKVNTKQLEQIFGDG